MIRDDYYRNEYPSFNYKNIGDLNQNESITTGIPYPKYFLEQNSDKETKEKAAFLDTIQENSAELSLDPQSSIVRHSSLRKNPNGSAFKYHSFREDAGQLKMASMELELRLVKDRLSTLEGRFEESNINTTNPHNSSKDRASQAESRPTYTHTGTHQTHHNRYYSISNINGAKSHRQYHTPRNSQPVCKKKFDTFSQSKDFSRDKTPNPQKSTGMYPNPNLTIYREEVL
jgi:hypothetical protein